MVPNGVLKLRQSRWIQRPSGHVMVDLEGRVSSDGKSIQGRVMYDGCADFSVKKLDAVTEAPQLPERAQAPVVTWQTATELAGSSYIAPECAAAIADDPTIMYFPNHRDEIVHYLESRAYFEWSRQAHFNIDGYKIEAELRNFGEKSLSANAFTRKEQIEKMTALIQARVAQFKKATKFCIRQINGNALAGSENKVLMSNYDLNSKSVHFAAGPRSIPFRGKNKTGVTFGGSGPFAVGNNLWVAEIAMSMEDGRWWEQTAESGGIHDSNDPVIFTVPKNCPKGHCEYEVNRFTIDVSFDGQMSALIYENGMLSLVGLGDDGKSKIFKKFKRIK